jgi:transposase
MRARHWPVDQVFVYLHPVDFRKSINGLTALVELELELDPFMPALYVFCNRQQDKVKLLYWERNGFVLWYKRLEKQRFCWPRSDDDDADADADVRELSPQCLSWLLDGVDIDRIRPHQSLHFGAQIRSI